jgi:hypothetical protein
MPQCQFPVFVFQKSYTGNILGIGRNEDWNSYFARRKDENQMGAGGGPEGTLTTRGAAQALAVPTCGEAALAHLWRHLFAYKKPRDGKS